MAQWLNANTALAQDLSSISSTHIGQQLTSTGKSSSRGPSVSALNEHLDSQAHTHHAPIHKPIHKQK